MTTTLPLIAFLLVLGLLTARSLVRRAAQQHRTLLHLQTMRFEPETRAIQQGAVGEEPDNFELDFALLDELERTTDQLLRESAALLPSNPSAEVEKVNPRQHALKKREAKISGQSGAQIYAGATPITPATQVESSSSKSKVLPARVGSKRRRLRPPTIEEIRAARKQNLLASDPSTPKLDPIGTYLAALKTPATSVTSTRLPPSETTELKQSKWRAVKLITFSAARISMTLLLLATAALFRAPSFVASLFARRPNPPAPTYGNAPFRRTT
jgi:hypothetical protein